MDHRWSVWLMPSKENRPKYVQIINVYSRTYSFPKFSPHITLFGRIDIDPRSTYQFFEKISTHDPIYLHTLGVSIGDTPWKSLYIQFKPNIFLNSLQSRINDKLKAYRNYNFDPHMSLAYGNLGQKNPEIDEISLDESIRFSSVALVYTSNDIDDWKVIKEYKFRSKYK